MHRLSLAGMRTEPGCLDCGGRLDVVRGTLGSLYARCRSCTRARKISSYVIHTAQGDPHVFVCLAEGPAWAAA
jgi:hypothetical protein